jgi:hypothetical protein
MKRLFVEGFTAIDIARPLHFFDAGAPAAEVRRFMTDNQLSVVAVKKDGNVIGYTQQEDLTDGICQDHIHNFDEAALLSQTSSYVDVINCLSASKYCFISELGSITAVITRSDIQKIPVRMWLFGMISIIEIYVSRMLEIKYPDGSWQKELSQSRLEKAQEFQHERKRRNQNVKLLDCLQLVDKARILMKDPDIREDAGFESRREAEKAIREFESLRNNLAHSNDLISYDWDAIVTVSRRLDKIMTRI